MVAQIAENVMVMYAGQAVEYADVKSIFKEPLHPYTKGCLLYTSSRGIVYDPFYAPNYFGRGGKMSTTGRFWAAMADYTMAIQLDSRNWLYWRCV